MDLSEMLREYRREAVRIYEPGVNPPRPHLSRLENWKDGQIYSTGIGANFEFRQRRSGKFLDFSRIRKDRRRSP